MTEFLYDNLSRVDLDAIAARIATDPAPARPDALRCLTAGPDDLDPDSPIAYEITWRGLTQLRRRDGARS